MLDFSVTFVITIINIIILCLILRLILFKPVTKFMDDRARQVKDSIEQSEKDKAQANALLAQYTAQLKTAETEADSIIRNAKEFAEAEAEKIIAKGRASAEQTLLNAKKQIETEQKAALAVFRQEAADLVVAASSTLLKREIKDEDSRQYAAALLEEVKKT
jgi:F-type H+-transporting ATPase subunit b